MSNICSYIIIIIVYYLFKKKVNIFIFHNERN